MTPLTARLHLSVGPKHRQGCLGRAAASSARPSHQGCGETLKAPSVSSIFVGVKTVTKKRDLHRQCGPVMSGHWASKEAKGMSGKSLPPLQSAVAVESQPQQQHQSYRPSPPPGAAPPGPPPPRPAPRGPPPPVPAPPQNATVPTEQMSPLQYDLETTKLDLQEKEVKFAMGSNYAGASRVQRARCLVEEMLEDVVELEQRERSAVASRDYDGAALAVRSLETLEDYMAEIKQIRDWDDPAFALPGLPEQDSALAWGTQNVSIRFTMPLKLEYGQNLVIAGSLPELGAWDADAAPLMRWTDDDLWVGHIFIPTNTTFQFKMVITYQEGGANWQPGGNAEVVVPRDVESMDVICSWDPLPGEERVLLSQPLHREPDPDAETTTPEL